MAAMRTAPSRLHGNQPPFFPSQRVVKRQRRILQIYSPRPFKVDFPHAPGKIIPQKFSEYVLAFPYQKGIRIKGAFPLHMRGMDASQRHIRPSCTVSLGVTVGASSRGSNRIHTYQIESPLRKRLRLPEQHIRHPASSRPRIGFRRHHFRSPRHCPLRPPDTVRSDQST